MEFAVSVYNKVKVKENQNRNNYLYFAKELKKKSFGTWA